MTSEQIKKQVKRIEDALTRHENYQRCDLSLSWISDRITWLWKFRYISEEKLNELCTRVIAIYDNM